MGGIFTDLQIWDVDTQGQFVIVDLVGGPQNCCGAERFREPDDAARAALFDKFYNWMSTGVLVDFLVEDDRVTLIPHLPPVPS